MSKKKRFAVSPELTRGFTETISVVENSQGIYRNAVIPLSRIELDPENPRKLQFSIDDAKYGINKDDSNFQIKVEEQEKLNELAETIRSSGIINPIIVYKYLDKYRVVAGERRCLASMIAGKNEIEARVFNEKPKGFNLRLVQWIENTAREDLSLQDRTDNIIAIYDAYQKENDGVKLSATLISKITGLSLSHATYYIALIEAPADVKDAIKTGHIKSLDKAAIAAKITDDTDRHMAIEACKKGISLKELRNFIRGTQLTKKHHIITTQKNNRGRISTRINFGYTNNLKAAYELIEAVLSYKTYSKYASLFEKYNYNDYQQTSKAFKSLLTLLEREV